MGIIASILDPVLSPLLGLGVFWAILIISLGISIIFTLVQKYATDQKKMKELKLEMKASQKKMKELRSDPERMMVVQKESMKKNMEYMKLSFRATLITIIPLLVIFSWMGGSLAFDSIKSGDTFSVAYIFKDNFNDNIEISSPEEIKVLGQTDLFKTKKSLFSSKEVNLGFGLDDIEKVEKIFLRGIINNAKGNLEVYLNGKNIFKGKTKNELAIKLLRDDLKRDNFIVLKSDLAFWRSNSIDLEDIRVIVDKNGEVDEPELEVERDGIKWNLKALEEGDYFLDFEHKAGSITKEVIITNKLKYSDQIEVDGKQGVVQIDYTKLKPLGDFNIFGWYPGWLGLYILFSLIFSLTLRKILKLY